VRIDCSAPTRIDLAGGTYDIWPLYLFHDGAQTINAAISLRAHAMLTSREDGRVVLISEDTHERVDVAGPLDLDVDRLPLIARLVRHFGATGLELTTRSESPVGAGIGGSSAMNIAVTAALAVWTRNDLGSRFLDDREKTTPGVVSRSDDDLLTLALNIEAQVIGVPTGVQDYRPAFFGGVSAVELGPAGVRRVAIAVDLEELTRRIVLVYTGASRQSGNNNWEVMQRRMAGDPIVMHAFDGIRDAALDMRHALVQQEWSSVGSHLAREWEHRKRLAPGVTTPEIESLLDLARAAGARAGKVCGAGGGGCLFCLVDPDVHAAVTDALAAAGALPLQFKIEREGVRMKRS
jgi:D-glycero-alpha-D-manno-heptose-7-phosphate kinase